MIGSLRQKLLFWFVLFSSTNIITLGIGIYYHQIRDQVAETLKGIDRVHKLFLQDYNAQMNFFIIDVRDSGFYVTGQSPFEQIQQNTSVEIEAQFKLLSERPILSSLHLKSMLDSIQQQVAVYDSSFAKMQMLVRRKGFRNYGEIGKMRMAAHKLEGQRGVDQVLLLNLRRHEKDFLLRNDSSYVEKFEEKYERLYASIAQNRGIRSSQKNWLLDRLKSYHASFVEVVGLEKKTGIKDNTGLKHDLDVQADNLATRFNVLLKKAEAEKKRWFYQLHISLICLGLLFLVSSIIISYFISRRITSPLVELTRYINKFVGSNFTHENAHEIEITDDEIGKLTLNFNVMRDKIIEQLRFFKQKVEERTEELAQLNEANSQFVPTEFINLLGHKSIVEVKLGDHVSTDMAIIFSDIRGFTELSEKLSPQENFDFINSYLKTIAPLTREHYGFIDKYIGDSIMALFPRNVDDALDTAIASLEALRRFDPTVYGIEPGQLSLGIGIHVGPMILGTIGVENRVETTVISDVVNTASRLEGLTKIYGGSIIVSDEVIKRLKNKEKYRYRYLDYVKVKGKHNSIAIYEVLNGLEPEEFQQKCDTEQAFLHAIDLYKRGEFKEALFAFRHVQARSPKDFTTTLYLKRTQEYLEEGIPEDWDGTTQLKQK